MEFELHKEKQEVGIRIQSITRFLVLYYYY